MANRHNRGRRKRHEEFGVEIAQHQAKRCEGKKRYSKKLARTLAKRYRKGERHCPGAWCIYAYKCPHCLMWHIGHSPSKGKGQDRPR